MIMVHGACGVGLVLMGMAASALGAPPTPLIGGGDGAVSVSSSGQTQAEWMRQMMAVQSLEELRRTMDDAAALVGPPRPFNQADLFFEENATAGDLGIHFDIDHSSEDAWRRLMIFFPDGTLFMNVAAGGAEAKTGVTGLFSESAEPPFEQVPPGEFEKRFPEGDYTIVGVTINGNMLMSTDTLTHDRPVEPVSISPAEGAVVEYDEPLVIRWRATPNPKPPESVIVAYEVIVTKEQPGEAKRVMSVVMQPTQRFVRVPREFLEPGKQYKYEILARETSHNQTITEVSFRTEEFEPKNDNK